VTCVFLQSTDNGNVRNLQKTVKTRKNTSRLIYLRLVLVILSHYTALWEGPLEPPPIRGNGNDANLLKLSLKTREMTAGFSHLEPLCGARQADASSSAAAKGREP
jgi:hypothetical protein